MHYAAKTHNDIPLFTIIQKWLVFRKQCIEFHLYINAYLIQFCFPFSSLIFMWNNLVLEYNNPYQISWHQNEINKIHLAFQARPVAMGTKHLTLLRTDEKGTRVLLKSYSKHKLLNPGEYKNRILDYTFVFIINVHALYQIDYTFCMLRTGYIWFYWSIYKGLFSADFYCTFKSWSCLNKVFIENWSSSWMSL